MVRKKRNSNIEALRIIAMFLIVLHHFAIHGIAHGNIYWGLSESPSGNIIVSQLLTIGGKVGVDIFIIISGYFLISSHFKLEKFLKLYTQIWTYSFSIFLILVICHLSKFSLTSFIQAIFPISFNQYRFITTYMLIYLFSPFINKLVHVISKAEYNYLLIILIIVALVIPTIMFVDSGKTVIAANVDNSPTTLFLFLYLVGAYIRIYGKHLNYKRVGTVLIFCGLLLSILLMSLMEILGNMTHKLMFNDYATFFFLDNSVYMFLIALGIFLIFLTFKPHHNEFINTIAGATFGVYLIHDNSFLSPVLWFKIIQPSNHLNLPIILFVLYAIGISVVVFFSTTVIDLLREKSIGRMFSQKRILIFLKKMRLNNLRNWMSKL